MSEEYEPSTCPCGACEYDNIVGVWYVGSAYDGDGWSGANFCPKCGASLIHQSGGGGPSQQQIKTEIETRIIDARQSIDRYRQEGRHEMAAICQGTRWALADLAKFMRMELEEK